MKNVLQCYYLWHISLIYEQLCSRLVIEGPFFYATITLARDLSVNVMTISSSSKCLKILFHSILFFLLWMSFTFYIRVVVSNAYLMFSQPPACLHQAM